MKEIVQFEQFDSKLRVLAPAKINLSLLIAGKRPDGYHELESIMAKIDYCDEIHIEPGTKPGIEFACTGPQWAPTGPDNLVWRAAQLLMDKVGKQIPVKITLVKNIPAGTGLGSGSSDAASTLLGLNRFTGWNLPVAELHPLAASLGSDINFFLEGPLAFCTGRGEKLHPLSTSYPFEALLMLPSLSTSTKEVYRNYKHDKDIFVQWNRKINDFLEQNRVDFVTKMCANMLQESCFRLHPELAAIKNAVEMLLSRKVCLSGSGSAMYCLLDENVGYGVESCRDKLKTDFNCASRIVHNNRW